MTWILRTTVILASTTAKAYASAMVNFNGATTITSAGSGRSILIKGSSIPTTLWILRRAGYEGIETWAL